MSSDLLTSVLGERRGTPSVWRIDSTKLWKRLSCRLKESRMISKAESCATSRTGPEDSRLDSGIINYQRIFHAPAEWILISSSSSNWVGFWLPPLTYSSPLRFLSSPSVNNSKEAPVKFPPFLNFHFLSKDLKFGF